MSRGEMMVGLTTLVVEECCNCGVLFAMPEQLRQKALEDRGPNGRSFYCPNGHGQHFTGKSDLDREREKRQRAEKDRDYAEASRTAAWDQARAAERRASAARGQVTKMRNRIKAGVCPVPGCKRTGLGEDVLAHIESKHPTWHTEHPEATT